MTASSLRSAAADRSRAAHLDPPSQPLVSSLREAMRGMASAVTLVTSCDESGTPHGMAATAVIPVSMEPASMLIAIHRNASLNPVLDRMQHFCINILPYSQREIVQAFSDSAMRHRRFADYEWATTGEGIPYLVQAQSAIFCRRDQVVCYGTHTLYIGQVEGVVSSPRSAPLIWFDGKPLEFPG